MANSVEQHEATGFRLSPQQELLLLSDPGISSQCAVSIDLDPERVRDALSELASRYEILRTVFVRSAGMRLPTQVILDEVQSVGPEPADDATLATVLEQEAARPFDLAAGPLVRLRIASADDGRQTLVLTAHPAVADGASLLEIARLASASDAEGNEPLQYADYAEWRAEVAAEAGEMDEEDDVATSPTLLFGRVPAADEPSSIRTHVLDIAPELADRLRASAEECKVSRPLFVEACWHACIHRLTGVSSLAVSGTSDGRNHDELVGAVGAFAQPVTVTSRLDSVTTLAEIVDQVRRSREAGIRSGDGLTGAALEAQARRTPLSFQSFETSLPARDVHALRSLPARTALQLSWLEAADDPRAELIYDAAAYGVEDLERVSAAFRTLLAGAASSTAAAVQDLPIVGAEEQSRLAGALRGPDLEIPARTYHELFEEQVARSPERPAVRDANGSLTYDELNARANALAAKLRNLGVGRSVPVGMCAHRSVESIVALVGILKAGGAYVPLNFDHPEARLLHQLTETGARVVVAESDLVDRLPSFDGEIVPLEASSADGTPNPEHVGDGDDLCYVMYTSGSTGLPKGVEITHENLVDYSLGVADRLGLSGGDPYSFAVVSAISTDLGNTSIFPPLLVGGCVSLIAPETAIDPEAFAAVAQEWGIDALKITPSHLTALLAGSESSAVLPRRLLVLGGEALPWDLVREISTRAPSLRIVNHYGPTETTVGACTFDLTTEVDAWRPRTVPIGRPLPNASAYVVDESGELVPPGVVGELLLGGPGVARGYVGRADETNERFAADRFRDGRLYRTGDRARALPDGSLEFLGRFDDQLKIRGYRVEPGEVEEALARHAAVTQAAVRALEDAPGNARLVAYTVTQPPVAGDELHAFLAEFLPDYMIPSAFVSLDSFPLTASGKIDRLALPDPDGLDADREASYVAPRDDVEEEIVRIWTELLGVERVGVFDDFFALGGHSLLATQVIMRVRRVYGDVPLQAMFMAPTPAGLADVIRAGAEHAEAAS